MRKAEKLTTILYRWH